MTEVNLAEKAALACLMGGGFTCLDYLRSHIEELKAIHSAKEDTKMLRSLLTNVPDVDIEIGMEYLGWALKNIKNLFKGFNDYSLMSPEEQDAFTKISDWDMVSREVNDHGNNN